MLWHEIVYVLSAAINGLTKHEIADRIVAATDQGSGSRDITCNPMSFDILEKYISL